MTAQKFWHKRARREAGRFNLGWILQYAGPCVFWWGLASSVVLLGARSAAIPLAAVWAGGLLALAIALGIAILRSRPRWIGCRRALAGLDAALRNHGALIASDDGVRHWPPPEAGARLPLAPKWNAMLKAPVLAFAALAFAALVPLPTPTGDHGIPPAGPPAWEDTRDLIAALDAAQIAEPRDLQALEKALQTLERSDFGEWFSPGGLEASDHLLASAQSQARDLAKTLELGLAALAALRSQAANPSTQQLAAAESASAKLAEALAGSEMAPHPDLASILGNPESALQLSQAEWEQLQQRIEQGAAACGNPLPADFDADTNGPGGALAASGRPERGPGSAPLSLDSPQSPLPAGPAEALSNTDLRTALPGDLLATSASVPEALETSPPGNGGSIAPGAEMGAVAPLSLIPSERTALQAYFQDAP